MRILILGAGKMGSFFADLLSFEHEVAVYDKDKSKLRFIYNTYRFTTTQEIQEFNPELLINAVTLKHTLTAFLEVIPSLSEHCIISDIASVKSGLKEFYATQPLPYVSTHPMFGPTFATLSQLGSENAIIINEGSLLGQQFFKRVYQKLDLNIFSYSFEEHDQAAIYSLATPFISTFAFLSALQKQKAPGTTFKRHQKIAEGVMNEDYFLLQEILFNKGTEKQIELITQNLEKLKQIIIRKDTEAMLAYLEQLRGNM
ncbi:MAG: prephenate dehydrogenase/arogenate dehydrogenase family protein [Bacteroides sp.]